MKQNNLKKQKLKHAQLSSLNASVSAPRHSGGCLMQRIFLFLEQAQAHARVHHPALQEFCLPCFEDKLQF